MLPLGPRCCHGEILISPRATGFLALGIQPFSFSSGCNAADDFLSGPHVDNFHPWPMSLISSIYGTDDDQEILQYLYTIANVCLLPLQ